MHSHRLDPWQHDHAFGATDVRPGEGRTRWVVALTIVTMVVELVAGWVFESMALLADGWHMATHTAALGIVLFSYTWARKKAHDPRYTFGTGKVSALGGFASAVALVVVSLLLAVESIERLRSPADIHFDEAIGVAILGLIVNVVSALLLKVEPESAIHAHSHGTASTHHHEHGAEREHGHAHDHNLRGAYLHVLADMLTSVLAILALLLGKYFGLEQLDAATGILGALVIGRWSLDLIADTSSVLLDAEISVSRHRAVCDALEAGSTDKVADLHLWRVGPRHVAAVATIVTDEPRAPDHYKKLLHGFVDLTHVTVEVQPCPGGHPPGEHPTSEHAAAEHEHEHATTEPAAERSSHPPP